MKYQFCLLLVAAIVAFSAGAREVAVDPVEVYDGPCDWKASGTPIAGCNGTDTLCSQGCDTGCNGFAKKEYYNPETISSGGNMQKTTTQVPLYCVKNKDCHNYAIGGRECEIVKNSEGKNAPSCAKVNPQSPSCGYCAVQSSNITEVQGYNIRTCPTGTGTGGTGTGKETEVK